MTQSEINAALIGALRHIAGAVLQEARETLALAKGGDHV
jgi:hypothetical protein